MTMHPPLPTTPGGDQPEVDQLRDVLRSAAPVDVARAAMRLAELGDDAGAAIPELVYALENGGGRLVHWAAAYALGELGPVAAGAAAALHRIAAGDPDGDIQVEARHALKRIAG